MVLARYVMMVCRSSKLHVSIFGALSIFRQSQYREKLGQVSGNLPICGKGLGRSEKC